MKLTSDTRPSGLEPLAEQAVVAACALADTAGQGDCSVGAVEDAAGRRVHRAFLASVRVFGEGVDITGERGVEAICFADTRGSQVEPSARAVS